MTGQPVKDILQARPELLRRGYDVSFHLARGSFTIYRAAGENRLAIAEGLTGEEAGQIIADLTGARAKT